jgi:hypothetical protein
MRPTLAVVCGAIAALAIAVPAASADTYCVSRPGCVGENVGANLQLALSKAQAHPGHDEVRIGPGTFAGPFQYAGGTSLTNGVAVQGSGSQTVLKIPAGASGEIVLSLAHSIGDRVNVSDLSLIVAAGDDHNALELVRGTASRIAVTYAQTAHDATGVSLRGSVLSDSSVDVPVTGDFIAVTALGSGSLVERSYVRGHTGVLAGATAKSTAITRSRIEAFRGIVVTCGKALVQDVTVAGPLLEHALAARTKCADNPEVDVLHLTAIAGVPGSSGVKADAPSAASSAIVRLRSSTLTGFGPALYRQADGGVATISTAWSNYSDAGQVSINDAGGTGQIDATNRIDVTPGFVNVSTGDFRLAPGSPLIDAGDPAPLETFESTGDFGGKPRIVAGSSGATARRDIGAHEYQPPAAPPADPPADPPPAEPEQPLPPPATGNDPEPPATPAAVAPNLKLSGARRQHVRRGRVVIVASADQVVTLTTTGSVKVGRKSFRLRGAAVKSAASGAKVKLTLKLSGRDTRRARRLLRRRGSLGRATITVTAKAASGLSVARDRRVMLVR